MPFWAKIPASVMAGMIPDIVTMMVGSKSTSSIMNRPSRLRHDSVLRGESEGGIRTIAAG